MPYSLFLKTILCKISNSSLDLKCTISDLTSKTPYRLLDQNNAALIELVA